MFQNRIFKVLGNLILLVAFSTGQAVAAPQTIHSVAENAQERIYDKTGSLTAASAFVSDVIGLGASPTGEFWDSTSGLLYASTSDGILSIIQGSNIISSIALGTASATDAQFFKDPVSGYLYLTRGLKEIAVIDGDQLLATLSFLSTVNYLEYNSIDGYWYVKLAGPGNSGSIVVLSVTSVINTITLPGNDWYFNPHVNPINGYVYNVSHYGQNVSVLNAAGLLQSINLNFYPENSITTNSVSGITYVGGSKSLISKVALLQGTSLVATIDYPTSGSSAAFIYTLKSHPSQDFVYAVDAGYSVSDSTQDYVRVIKGTQALTSITPPGISVTSMTRPIVVNPVSQIMYVASINPALSESYFSMYNGTDFLQNITLPTGTSGVGFELYSGPNANIVIGVNQAPWQYCSASTVAVLDDSKLIGTINLNTRPKGVEIAPDKSFYLWTPCENAIRHISIGYSISGFVMDRNGNPISGATISDGTSSTITNGNGAYLLSGLDAGSHTITPSKTGYDFDPPSRVYPNIQSNQTAQNYIGTFNPPLILVHGFQGLSTTGGYHCSNDGIGSNDIERYQRSSPTTSNSTLNSDDGGDALADWLAVDHDVWIAHLETTPLGTPSLEFNARCLRDQIDYVYSQNPQPITMVAHSMGGVVSRAAIRYLSNQQEVKSLFTLGSPHAGLPTEVISILPIACDIQQGACDMSVSHMMFNFNVSNPNVSGVSYNFIGGSGGTGFLDSFLKFTGQGPNDGLVGQYSAVGWINPNQIFAPPDWPSKSIPGHFFTSETHPAKSDPNKAYYVAPSGQTTSTSYKCISGLMKNPPDSQNCQSVAPQAVQTKALASGQSSLTEIKSGHLTVGQSIALPLVIDNGGAALFYLNWSGGNAPTFILTRPDAQVIDPAYAVAHPSEVTYEVSSGSPETAPAAAYSFISTQVGTWQADVTATDAIDYKIFGLVDSTLQLTAETNAEVYQIGDVAMITASLDSNGAGLSGASVTATLTRADGVVDTVSLTDHGNGTYTNTYIIPNAPGHLTIDVSANGTDGGTAFSRQANLLAAIAPNNLQLTAAYTDQGRDQNTDGFYDYLDFTAEAILTTPGEYAISAELYAGDQLIGQAGEFLPLASGTQILTLSFDGREINQSGLDGPYTIKNLNITPIDVGITAQSVGAASTTGAYSYTQFVDGVNPVVSSVIRTNLNPSNTTSVDFTVTFSEPVTDVNLADFVLTSTRLAGASLVSVTGSGSVYTVTVNTGTGNGTIRLDVVDNNSIVDLALNPLGGAGVSNGDFSNGQVYTIIKSATFADVPLAYWSNGYIERLYNAGITGGCTTVPLNYCPATQVTRAQMAIFLLRGIHGSSYTPPAATGTVFSDVSAGSFGAAWIEQLAMEGITGGCGGGKYCPTTPVTRAQMAIFLLRAKHGAAYVPPTATGTVFADISTGTFGAAWIEQLASEGVTGGCTPTTYCPTTPVTRAQMAVFLVKTFNLP